MFLKPFRAPQALFLICLFISFPKNLFAHDNLRVAQAMACGVGLLAQSKGFSIQDSKGIKDWMIGSSLADAPGNEEVTLIRDRLLHLLKTKEFVQSLHVSGKRPVAKFLMEWADFVDQYLAKNPSEPIPRVALDIARGITTTSLVASLYGFEMLDPAYMQTHPLLVPLAVFMSYLNWIALNPSKKSGFTGLPVATGLILPAFLIPGFVDSHFGFTTNLLGCSILGGIATLMFSNDSSFSAALESTDINEMQAHAPPIASPAREFQTHVQCSRENGYQHIVINVGKYTSGLSTGWVQTRYLDLFLYEGDDKASLEPELLIVGSNLGP